jgi:aerobic-type carbon monoxide dehydrogenase small subunit (CoxS/CutS family)
VTTIEGLERNGKLHPLQQAFLNVGAMQCGYCTPGMIMNGYALLGRLPSPTTEEIVRSMEGNVCRCGTYIRILQAIRQAADAMKNGHGHRSLTEGKDGARASGRVAVKGGVE